MSHYYGPIRCRTGAAHQQPENLAPGCAFALTANYEHMVDMRGALDAPEAIPCGAVRALDFDTLCIACAHTYRDGGVP